MTSQTGTKRTLGLLGATGVGVGAIVGGGILALAGVAFATTGPAAMVAFGLNGVIALLAALSFAEMASKFPESGGTYTYAKKVLTIEAAFMVGWVVWFASMVAAVLYAVGFSHFCVVMAADVCRGWRGESPSWLHRPGTVTGLAFATTLILCVTLMRRAAGGGAWVNVGKVVVFGALILGGVWAVVGQPLTTTGAALRPFFPAGGRGVIQAMGYTFIALQGFDLIAAVGGEVRDPTRNLPRSMVLSLAIALVIYLPLLFVITTVGVPAGTSITTAAAANPEGIVAVAARQYLGAFGYWLVIVAAILSMFSALQANLFAASRIAQAMASDRTLPTPLSQLHPRRGTPVMAVAVTAGLVAAMLWALPDVQTAGAASSLIFLITFAITQWVAILVRRRSARQPPPFRVPLFPLVPVVGGLACLGLAVFQGVVVPSAGLITMVWLSLGGLLFLALFARRARVMDVSSRAFDPELVTLRGRTPLVLVPIANPHNAAAMMTLANTLVPAHIGRVLTHTVAVAPVDWQPDGDPAPIEKTQAVLSELWKAATLADIRIESLTTIAPHPMEEIARVARLHRCESVVLGLSTIAAEGHDAHLEALLGRLDANVVVLRSRHEWQLKDARRILIPVAGRGDHEHLRAMLLGSLLRTAPREVTFLRVLPADATVDDRRRSERMLRQVANDEVRRPCQIEVLTNDDPLAAVAARADNSDLLILGVQRHGRHKKLFGGFTRQLAQRTNCPLIVISRRG